MSLRILLASLALGLAVQLPTSAIRATRIGAPRIAAPRCVGAPPRGLHRPSRALHRRPGIESAHSCPCGSRALRLARAARPRSNASS